MDILVTYDIADTEGAGATRLRGIAQVCAKYGERVQKSVFECRLSSTRFAVLLGEIEDVIDSRLDSVIVYRFPGGLDKSRRRFGRASPHELGKPWVL